MDDEKNMAGNMPDPPAPEGGPGLQSGAPAGPDAESAPPAGADGLRFAQEEADRPGKSYWQIVASQFRKNRLAVWSMRVLILLFLLAIYAPVISHNVPFHFKDNLRSRIGDGDVVTVGRHSFKVVKSEEAAPAASQEGEAGEGPRSRFNIVDETGARFPILGEVTAGSRETCAIRRPDLPAIHARFGLFRDSVYVEDVSGGRSVQVNGLPVGSVEWPWFASLFDRNEFETDIDIVFNLLVFYLPPALAAFLAARFFMKGRPRAWKAGRVVCAVILACGLGGAFALTKLYETKIPFRDFKAEIEASGGEKSGVFPLIPHSYRQQFLAINQKPPWRTAYFGKTGDSYRAEFGKNDEIRVCGNAFKVVYKSVELPGGGVGKARHFLKDSAGREYVIDGRITIGSGPGCQVGIQGPGIAEAHATVETEDGKFWVEDLTRTGTVTAGGIPANGVQETLFSRKYVFGADQLGRSVFSRLLYGTRISLTIGIIAVSIYVTIGIFIGGIAGYFGGIVDILVSRVIEIMICFPTFFLILSLVAVLGKSIFMVMLIIGVTNWTGVARLIRGEFLKQKQIDYVTAARALGVSRFRIMFKHILPNAISPVLVSASFGVAGAILVETGLSFLGLGDARTPSWGQILDAGRASKEAHLIHLPGLAIFMTVAIMNLMGEGLRDALDPKLRK